MGSEGSATLETGEQSATHTSTTHTGATGPVLSDNSDNSELRQVLSTGNRVASPSVAGCLRSLAYLHNETVNIYSHALGAVLFFALTIFILKTETLARYRVVTTADRLVCSVYFLSASTSFLLSAMSHTFLCYSERVSVLVTRIHFLSLILLLWGVNVPLIYYGFFCDLVLQIIYWAITTSVALICSVFSLFPIGYIERHPQRYMTATCASLTATVIAPIVHGLVAEGLAEQVPRLNLQWLIYALIVFTFGLAAHALKFPEHFPELFKHQTFHIFGASHQIMHVMILGASIMYTFCMFGQVNYVHDHQMRCPV